MRLKQQSFRWRRALATLFLLFQKGLRPSDATDTIEKSDDEAPGQGRIRCPMCRWQPDAGSSWGCGDCAYPERFFGGCGMVWNTFDTRGLCPGCGHQWRWTACSSCSVWSLHEDWYAKDGE
ncbi:MAG TPA: hypothetical protein VJZ77_19045 [Blastocatellia bacterium]|nr:hypothetical protein [Blastocatellia bacterium]